MQSFEQVFERPGQSTVLLQARAQLIDSRSEQVLGARSFRWSRVAIPGDAAGAVAAFSGLVDLARSELSTWVGSLAAPAKANP